MCTGTRPRARVWVTFVTWPGAVSRAAGRAVTGTSFAAQLQTPPQAQQGTSAHVQHGASGDVQTPPDLRWTSGCGVQLCWHRKAGWTRLCTWKTTFWNRLQSLLLQKQAVGGVGHWDHGGQ